MTPVAWKKTALTALGIFALIQLVPYGHQHDNPAGGKEPNWDRPETRALAARACFDCHSDETVWPAYSHVAPLSWIIVHHVDEGREHLNFSRWDKPQKDADEAVESVLEGEMPLGGYLWLHPDARLSESERRLLVSGLEKTLGPTQSGHH